MAACSGPKHAEGEVAAAAAAAGPKYIEGEDHDVADVATVIYEPGYSGDWRRLRWFVVAIE